MNSDEFLAILQQANENGKLVNPMAMMDSKENRVNAAADQKSTAIYGTNPGSYDATLGRDGKPLDNLQYQSENGGYTMTPNGPNRNKDTIYNDYNGEQMQGLTSNLHDARVYRDEAGRKYQMLGSDGQRTYVDPNMDTGFVYMGDSKTDPGVDKVGYSKYGVKPRYDNGILQDYGWESGPDGIDANNAYMNWEVPRDVAKNYEAISKGNKYNLAARTHYDDGTPEAADRRNKYLSGATEYYNENQMPVFDQNIGSGHEGGLTGARAGTPLENVLSRSVDPHDQFLDGIRNSNSIGASNYNDDGRAVTAGKTILAGAGNILQNVMDTGSEGVAWAGEKAGLWDEAYKEQIGKVHDTDLKKWQKMLNVNSSFSETATKDLQQKVKDGDYMGAIGSVFQNLDVHLSQSIPEMGALALKVPGLMASVNSRVKEQTSEFIAKNGREPTNQETAAMWATNTAILVPEQLLLVGPLKTIFKAAKKGAATAGKGFQSAGATLGQKAGNVAKTVGFETVQEIGDQTQEQYWKKGGSGDAEGLDALTKAGELLADGKIITPDEAIAAGIAGGVMGGALRGGAEVRGITDAASNSYKLHGIKKSFKEADKYLSEQDKEFANMSVENDNENQRAKRASIKEARSELAVAKKSKSPIALMSKSSNPLIKDFAKGIKSSHINLAGNTLDHKNDSSIAATVSSNLGGNQKALSILGLNDESLSSMSEIEVSKAVNKVFEDKAKRGKLISSMTDDVKVKIFDDSVKGKDLKSIEEGLVPSVDNTLEKQDVNAERRIKNNTVATELINKSKGRGNESGKIQSEDWKTSKYPSLREFVTSPLSRDKTKALRDINRYDNKSIREAIDIADSPKKKKWLQAVLDKRENAKKTVGIGSKGQAGVNSSKYVAISENEKIGKDKIETVEALKSMMGKTEFRTGKEVDNAKKFIDKAFEAKHINEKQKKILENRLDSINQKTKYTASENERRARAAKKRATVNTTKKTESKNTSDVDVDFGEYEYTDNAGKTFKGTVLDDSDGEIVVESHDGEVLVFDAKTGRQLVDLGEKEDYVNGRSYTDSESNKKSNDDTTVDEAFDEEFNEDEELDEDMLEAAAHANNLEAFGEDFDPKDLTDEDLDKLSPELKVLFDC